MTFFSKNASSSGLLNVDSLSGSGSESGLDFNSLKITSTPSTPRHSSLIRFRPKNGLFTSEDNSRSDKSLSSLDSPKSTDSPRSSKNLDSPSNKMLSSLNHSHVKEKFSDFAAKAYNEENEKFLSEVQSYKKNFTNKSEKYS